MRIAALVLLASSLSSFGCAASATPTPGEPPTTAADEVDPAEPKSESESEPESSAAADPSLCASAGEDWQGCDGQRVEIRGRAAEMVMQHPMVNQPEGLSPDNRNTQQGYMDTDSAQLIVLTAEPFACTGEMTVVGVLRGIDLDPNPDAEGKNSYGGWSITDAEVTCD